MSSAVLSTSAALGCPFVFDSKVVSEVSLPFEPVEGPSKGHPAKGIRHPSFSAELVSSDPRLAQITPASRLDIRPAPEMVSSGIPAIDALTGGLPRGCLTEICGPASSGRTTLLLSALAAATRRGEFCVVVDASDVLDPHSAAAAGVDLDRLLWVRCDESSPQKERSPRRHDTETNSLKDPIRSKSKNLAEQCLEQVLRATDLLLESGGFGLIVLDLGDLSPQAARRIPLTTWFRFRRAIEHTPTILLAIEQHPIAGSCSSLLLQLGPWNETTAERRKNAAHGPSTSPGVNSSRGFAVIENEKAPKGRKKICIDGQSTIEFQIASPTHAQLLTGLDITAEIRSRLERRPARSVMFASKTAWAG